MARRKTLPKEFDAMLKTASLDELKAVFDRTMLDARGGSSKQTAIGFVECPDELIIWLVEQGLDVDASDLYEDTPLWTRASRGRAVQIPLLLSLGRTSNDRTGMASRPCTQPREANAPTRRGCCSNTAPMPKP
ncbi:putative ankyrin repeat-containing protein [Rhodococcus sp. MTM3W5.2]|uniref:hypothetical protein n=1 Tax=Rhodococcus sp. MTM3W5.2 TaxID=1805827 RepID=UPI00097956A4|nr:hypothetical protein [Rhodococcus sp. MTM3W5.2]AQA23836.1 putative ankyrin repeat-containing protein [Rhodococcus sp. MTM3W5.2]